MARHGPELVLERLRRARQAAQASLAARRVAAFAAELATMHEALPPPGRVRLRAAIRAALAGDRTLIPLLHLARTVALQRHRGFHVHCAGFADGAPYDLEIAQGTTVAEIACDVISAEEGRGVPRGAWMALADRVDPDLQTWLAAHPGRYLLKITLPDGLSGSAALPALHRRIRRMLAEEKRADQTESAVLRLDPLLIAGSQADEAGMLARLRAQFGDEAHLAATITGSSVFVMAARAGRGDMVAAAMRRRLGALAPTRLTGSRPGILSVFIEDTDSAEWRQLRDRLQLEGEARHFLTCPEARPVVAVTCASRMELFGMADPHAARDGEVRFRNHAHPAANDPGLRPAIASSL
jgi:hypothetical protein